MDDYDEKSTAFKFSKCHYLHEFHGLIDGFSIKWMINRIQTLSLTPIQNALDVGCGEGSMARMLIRDGIVQSLVGLDRSEDMIHLAQKAVQEHEKEHFQYYCIDIETFQTTTNIHNKFDLVISTFMLCHMTSKEQLYRILSCVRQLCKSFFIGIIPNPSLHPRNAEKHSKYGIRFTDPSSYSDEERYFVTFDTNTINEFTLGAVWYTAETYENLFRKAGFVTFEWIPLMIDPTASKDRREYMADACSWDIGFIASV